MRVKSRTPEGLLAYIKSISPDKNGCINWNMARHPKGYGKYAFKQFTVTVHRWVYQYHFPGEYDGLVIRHKCDNPSCVNIDHLEHGTALQNSQDMIDRGRQQKGSRHWNSKLTDEDVSKIRSLYPALTCKQIAEKYNVRQGCIEKIVRGAMWKHVPASNHAATDLTRMGEAHQCAKLKEQDIIFIRSRYHDLGSEFLAEKYGVCKGHITRIWQRKKWKHIP